MVGIENLSRRLARAEKERRAALESQQRAAQEAAAPAASSEAAAPAEVTAEAMPPAAEEAVEAAAHQVDLGGIMQRLPLPRLDRLLLLLIVSFLAGMLLAHLSLG